MHPILFQFGGFTLYSFGLMIGLAFWLGFTWIFARAKAAGENVDLYWKAALWIIISALVGARLLFIVYEWPIFLKHPLELLFSRGGLVWYGGMSGVLLAIITLAWLDKFNLWRFCDVIAPPSALGLAIGRIGCFLAGCCYGSGTHLPWAVQYPKGHETQGHWVHPAPLYESLALFIITLLLTRVDQTKRFEGQPTVLFFILYGIVRFLLEYIRGDRLIWIAALNLSASQVISLAGILIGSIFWVALTQKQQAKLASEIDT